MKAIDKWAGTLGVHSMRPHNDNEFWALCPCHADANPSLHVYEARKIGRIVMKCFACGADGTAVCDKLGVTYDQLILEDDDQLHSVKKPPLGIEPRYVWEEKRRQKIRKAVTEYMNAGLMVPEAWIEEWNELTSGGKVDLIHDRFED